MSEAAAAGSGGAPKVPDFDELVDEVLARKGRAKYTDGLSEDHWEEELERIPLFMTKSPEEVNADLAPGIAALQDLKYQEGSPHSRAVAHKEDGNEQFKKKRYKAAITAYTAGLKEKAEDSELTAILFCNRAASNYHLENYRSSLSDATEARKANPEHMKAIIRGAECCVKLERLGEVLEWCDEGLRRKPGHTKLWEIRSKAAQEKKKQDRDRRKEAADEKKRTTEQRRVVKAIKSRGIRMSNEEMLPTTVFKEEEDPLDIELKGPHPSGAQVHLSPEGVLIWPVMLMFPEFGETDFIETFRENDRFCDHMAVMYETHPPWDPEGKCTYRTVQLYHEDHAVNVLRKVNMVDTLNAVISSVGYRVVCGTPTFIALSTTSSFTHSFLSRT